MGQDFISKKEKTNTSFFAVRSIAQSILHKEMVELQNEDDEG